MQHAVLEVTLTIETPVPNPMLLLHLPVHVSVIKATSIPTSALELLEAHAIYPDPHAKTLL